MFRFIIGIVTAIGLICLLAHAVPGVVVCAGLDAYFASLVIWPMRACVSCHGRKRHGRENSANSRRCWTCKGHGEYPRWGVILLRRDVIARIKAGEHGRNF